MPDSYLVGRILSHDVVDAETGELLATANDEITEEHAGEVPQGRHRRQSARSGSTTSIAAPTCPTPCASTATKTQLEALVEIYRMMRPGEPPTKDAAQNLFHNLFFTFERYDLSAVGRMKFNRRIGRKEVTGASVLYDARTSPSARTRIRCACARSSATCPTSST